MDTLDNTEISSEDTSNPFNTIPSYIIAADNHAVANGDMSLTDALVLGAKTGAGIGAGAAMGTAVMPILGTAVGAAVGGMTGYTDGKMTAAAVISGISSFANSAIAVANMLPGEVTPEIDTAELMRKYDDNLPMYYEAHKDAADQVGFVLGSLIPGTAALKGYNYATKMLNAAKVGALGANMEVATGLLGSMQAENLALAKEAMTSTASTFGFLNKNLLVSLAAGAGEQAIQGAVFELAVAGTMFKSPVLEDMDYKDIAMNIVHGAVFSGIAGGGIEAVMSVGKLKSALSEADAALRPLEGFGGEARAGATPDERIMLLKEAQLKVPKPETIDPEGTLFGGRAARLYDSTMKRLPNDIRTIFQEITGGNDAVIANMAHDIVAQDNTLLGTANKVMGLREIGRLNTPLKAEIELKKLRAKSASGKELLAEEQAALNKYTITYTKAWGEGAETGAVVTQLPATGVGIQDTLKVGERIIIDSKGLKAGNKSYPQKLLDNMRPHDTSLSTVLDSQARELWLMHQPSIPAGATIFANDLPALRKVFRDSAGVQGTLEYKLRNTDGTIVEIGTRADVLDTLNKQARTIITQLQQGSLESKVLSSESTKVAKLAKYNAVTKVQEEKAARMSNEEIALLTNTRLTYVERTAENLKNPASDLLAMDSFAEEYASRMQGLKTAPELDPTINSKAILLQPQHIKMVHDASVLNNLDANQLEAITYVKQRQKMYQQEADVVVTKVLGELSDQLVPITEDVLRAVDRNGAGATTVAGANGTYATAASIFERVGQVTNRMIVDASNKITTLLDPSMYKLQNDTDATLELSTIMHQIRNTPERYILNEAGDGLILKGYADYLDGKTAGIGKVKPYEKLDVNAPDEIPINSALVREFIDSHISANGARLDKFATLRAVNKTLDTRDQRVLYFPPPDLADYKYFAFVTDPSVTGTGHMKMIWAHSEAHLDALISKVPTEFQDGIIRHSVNTKADVERWHKAIGDYSRQDTIGDNYMDAALHRSGAAAPYFPETDAAKIVKGLRDWHTSQERAVVREAVSLKYSKEFAELKRLDDQFNSLATSRPGFSSLSKYTMQGTDSPYMSYVRTALDLPNSGAIPLRAQQAWLDNKVSEVWNTITGATLKTTSVSDLDKINQAWESAGIKTGYYDAVTNALVNDSVAKGALTTFAKRANAILASITLRPDVLNAINNIVGSTVLLSPELALVRRAIATGDATIVGKELAGLAHVDIPGTTASMFSPTKLFSQSIKNWFNPELREFYKSNGWTTRRMMEVQAIHDELSVGNLHTTADLNSKLENAYNKTMKFFDWAEKKSGNAFAEEFTRFIAADMMHQITSVAVKHDLMSEKLAGSLINTFVNRTQGNYLASQRPMMFHGAVGQAIGLFQTYQVNMLQQMLRHVANGDRKTAAIMLGAQSTIYGMNGLPGFQAINTHLVGSLAGNSGQDGHKDLYSALYSAVDKGAADWLMYGAISNTLGLLHPDLKMNMYTRGDINPRQPTIIPLDPRDLPIVQASGKFFGNLLDMTTKLAGGGDISNTLLQGLEHNGLSRPLAGIAQVLESTGNSAGLSYSTNSSGNLIATNELLSVANLTRLLGAKPLDDAKAIDFAFRSIVYKAKDSDARDALGEAIKSKVIGQQEVTEDDMHKFAVEYAKRGGKQEGFNRFYMNLFKEANTPQANRIVQNLKSHDSQRMQELIGGRMIDFNSLSEQPSEEQ